MTGVATVTTTMDRYLSAFEALERDGMLRGPAWLQPLRRAAIVHVGEAGFPSTRDEAWRYTNLAMLAATPFTPAMLQARADVPAGAIERLALGATHGPRLVFVDGRFSPHHSTLRDLPAGARVSSLAEAMTLGPVRTRRVDGAPGGTAADGSTGTIDGALLEAHLARHAAWDCNVFAALNAAFFEDGALLHLPADVSVASPIELLFVAATPGTLSQPRILMVAGPHSRATVVERYVGLVDGHFTNVVTEIVAGHGAAVDHYAVQEEGTEAFHVATVDVRLVRDAAFSTCGVTVGGRLTRTTVALRFDGEGARGAVRGLYMLDGHQHVDNHVTVDHAVPRCSSAQLFKGILDGSSRAVFNGRILVRPDAQKTNADQTNKHLLLSDGVEVDTKPQLEIFADDVRCTHGAAEGQLGPEALFYLRSRGLAEAAARALLTYGFAHEVVAAIAPEPVRAYVEGALTARLGSARAPGGRTALEPTSAGQGRTERVRMERAREEME